MNHLQKYIILSTLVLFLSSAKEVSADTVWAKRQAQVHQHAGEESRVIATASRGQQMTTQGSRGSWLKVTVNGATGWIKRNSVTRRNPATKTGFDGKLETNTRANKPRKPAGKTARPPATKKPATKPSQSLVQKKQKTQQQRAQQQRAQQQKKRPPKQKRRQPSKANSRFVRNAQFSQTPAQQRRQERKQNTKRIVTKTKHRKDTSITKSAQGTSKTGLQIDTKAGIGFHRIAMSFRSNGEGNLANYTVSSAAASLAIDASFVFREKRELLYGIDTYYIGSISTPGIQVESGTQKADTSFTSHELAVTGLIGYQLSPRLGVEIVGRIGYYHQFFLISNINDLQKNLARLPSESLFGITTGFQFNVARITKRISASVRADALFPGWRRQTAGLEDGNSSSTLAGWASARFAYIFKGSWAATTQYRFAYAKTDFSGAARDSQRSHGADNANRTDTGHLITLGVSTTF